MDKLDRRFTLAALTLLVSVSWVTLVAETNRTFAIDSHFLVLAGLFIALVSTNDLFKYKNTPLACLIISFASILLTAGCMAIGWEQPEGVELKVVYLLLVAPCVGLIWGAYYTFSPTWHYTLALPLVISITAPFIQLTSTDNVFKTMGALLLTFVCLSLAILIKESTKLTWEQPSGLYVVSNHYKINLSDSCANASLLVTLLYTLPYQDTLESIECYSLGLFLGFALHAWLKLRAPFVVVGLCTVGGWFAYLMRGEPTLLESCFISLFMGLAAGPSFNQTNSLAAGLALPLFGFLKLYSTQQAELIHLMGVLGFGIVSQILCFF